MECEECLKTTGFEVSRDLFESEERASPKSLRKTFLLSVGR